MEETPIKLVLLKDRPEYLIGIVTELDEEPSLLIETCYEIVDGDLIPFPKYSAQRDMFLTSETILTILDPSPEVLEKYKQE
ncbi:Rnf-Nqr protein [Synechococcus phage S-BM1]|nr:Rnf-Nqr protein [Synechococcus phage S-BM1]